MGTIYHAICPCGFDQPEIYEGWGMIESYGGTTLNACDKCRKIFTLNSNKKKPGLLGEQSNCPRCGNLAACTYTVELDSDEQHHCPACHKKILRFIVAGLWD